MKNCWNSPTGYHMYVGRHRSMMTCHYCGDDFDRLAELEQRVAILEGKVNGKEILDKKGN